MKEWLLWSKKGESKDTKLVTFYLRMCAMLNGSIFIFMVAYIFITYKKEKKKTFYFAFYKTLEINKYFGVWEKYTRAIIIYSLY